MIRAAIIDDEENSINTLKALLKEYCNGVQVLYTAGSVEAGIKAIRENAPDILFLDITMADGDGFEVLTALPGLNFKTIFTTAHHEFALKAFEFSALHYLLKPIDPDELKVAVGRYTKPQDSNPESIQYDILQKGLGNEFLRMALPSMEGITFVDIDDIVRCEAADSY